MRRRSTASGSPSSPPGPMGSGSTRRRRGVGLVRDREGQHRFGGQLDDPERRREGRGRQVRGGRGSGAREHQLALQRLLAEQGRGPAAGAREPRARGCPRPRSRPGRAAAGRAAVAPRPASRPPGTARSAVSDAGEPGGGAVAQQPEQRRRSACRVGLVELGACSASMPSTSSRSSGLPAGGPCPRGGPATSSAEPVHQPHGPERVLAADRGAGVRQGGGVGGEGSAAGSMTCTCSSSGAHRSRPPRPARSGAAWCGRCGVRRRPARSRPRPGRAPAVPGPAGPAGRSGRSAAERVRPRCVAVAEVLRQLQGSEAVG